MKAIMYHYVRSDTDRQPYYYYLDVNDFRSQLDYFGEEFGFVTKEEFLSVIRGENGSDKQPSGVVLTFDDGFRDHYKAVYPELQKRGLWGIFYVPVGQYITGQLLDVHRTHVLLGEISGTELLEHARDIVTEEMVPHKRRDEFREQTYENQDDTKATKKAKRILNFFLSDEYQTNVLNELTERVEHDPVAVSDFYMTQDELNEMHANGMVIGGHTVTHPVLSKLSPESQRTQITESFEYLDNAVEGLSERTFCYPYGNSYSFTENTVSILDDLDCEWCFKVKSADITTNDITTRSQALPRYDCTDFPNGEASGSIGPSHDD
jgi:peptidoglycan/xylan/chitin deacetylase (PgdA/CDA1 family)